MLDERKTSILRAVVQEYITTAQPVGSTHIADLPGVRVSSATVRNEMAVLEQEGYLAQPHTSAGRVPTDKGYRFFVDHITTPGRLDTAATQRVGTFFDTLTAGSRSCCTRPPICSLRSRNTPPSSSGRAPNWRPSARCRSSACRRVTRWWWPCSATAPSTARRSSSTPTRPTCASLPASAHLQSAMVGHSDRQADAQHLVG